MEGAAPATPSGRPFPCPGCGASLAFAPGTTELRCGHCGFVQVVPQSAEEVDEHDYEAWLAAKHPTASSLSEREVRCEGCGAITATTKIAQSCPFCGANVLVPVEPVPSLAPEAVVPFAIVKDAALVALRAWLRSLWFAPSTLKSLAAHDGIRGVYVPHYTFDSATHTWYSGQRGDHYYVSMPVVSRVGGRTTTRMQRVRKTHWTGAAGQVARAFDDVLVPAMPSLPRAELSKLEPWDLKAASPFRGELLAGFEAGHPEIDLRAAFASAQERMREVIRNDCCRDIGGDEQRVDSMKTSWSALTFKLVLLPAWVAAYRYDGKAWRVLVNARSGEVQGERPWSKWKIAFLVLAIAAAIAVIVVVAN